MVERVRTAQCFSDYPIAAIHFGIGQWSSSSFSLCVFVIGTKACIEAIPDVTPLMKPSTLGDVATYFFFSAGGLFLGGETGLLTGSGSASRTISKDPETRARVETAFRKFRADVLRKEADALDGGKGVSDMLGF